MGADADPDNDGANNTQEFANQSNPLDPLSGFAVQVRLVRSMPRFYLIEAVRQ